MKSHVTGLFYEVRDRRAFEAAMLALMGAVPPDGLYVGDNLFAYCRNLGFLDDAALMAAVARHGTGDVERAILWRTHVAAWAAHNGLRRAGDFVECGCYKGYTARVICDYLGFASLDRRYYVYDLFEHDAAMPHHALKAHGADLHAAVAARFADAPNVSVIKGRVPESFAQGVPEAIAFLHIDLNSAAAEIAALDALFDRVSPGGIVLLDDYGWTGYRAQKDAEDAFAAARGYKIVELPTGQGMIVK